MLQALYPGYVHLREYLMEKEYAEELYPDEHYFCITRSDTSIIDGRWAGASLGSVSLVLLAGGVWG